MPGANRKRLLGLVWFSAGRSHGWPSIRHRTDGEHGEVVIARYGRPVARLTSLRPARAQRRLGVAKGCCTVPDPIDAANPLIQALFDQP